MKHCLSIILVFTLVCVGFGQVKKSLPKVAPTPIVETKKEDPKATQKIFIEKLNGDKLTGLFVSGNAESIIIEISETKLPIKLNEIKTIWFNESVEKTVSEQPSEQAKEEPNANLFLEAAIVYRSGEVVPVARTEFYLLDDDVVNICYKANVLPTTSTFKTYNQDYNKALLADLGFMASYAQLPDYQKFGLSFVNAIKPHILYTLTTDFLGKATINVPKGNYSLFGITSSRKSGVVWNLQIKIVQDGQLVLDAKNAAFAY